MSELQSTVIERTYRQPSITLLPPPSDWRAQAVAAYERGREDRDEALRRALARRVRALTGQVVPPERIWVDRVAQTAGVALDGALFRLERGQLVLVRPCALCGIGQIASPPLDTPADLGYALSEWQPRHPACAPDDPPNWLEE